MKPLDGDGCVRLQSLMRSHGEIAEFIARIRTQGRPIWYADLGRANSWIYHQRCEAQDRACRELNGLESAA